MKSLRKYAHINAGTVEEVVALLRQYGDRAWVIAGGTDLVGTMRFDVLQNYPEVLINLKTIPGLDQHPAGAQAERAGNDQERRKSAEFHDLGP